MGRETSSARAAMGGRCLLPLAAVLLLSCSAAPTLHAQEENRFFEHTTDPNLISMQIRLALPGAKRGLEVLQAATTPEQITAAVDAIFESYKYLRAAQESNEILQAHARYRDPVVSLRNERIWRVRQRLRWCRDNRGYLTAQNQEVTATCTEGLSGAVRDLQVIVATTP